MTLVETAVDMSTALGSATIPSPVLTASGCSAFGRELEPFVDLAAIGAVVTKSVQLRARSGRPTPRMAETPSGMLNSIGLQGPGIDGLLAEDLPWLAGRGARQRGRHVDVPRRAKIATLAPLDGQVGHATTPIASAPTTSAVSVPTSANRTRSPPNTGPSTQDRANRVRPSAPTTGSTQVMQTPIPQAIDSSTATYAGTPAAVASSLTARSIPIGPQA